MPGPLAAMVVAALTVTGCFGGDDKPKPTTGTPTQAAAVVTRLERATANGDYRGICDELFTPAARRRSGGRDCPSRLRSQVGEVTDPRLELLAIELQGDRARMRVRARSRGQATSTDTLELVRTGGRYRIDALGD